MEGWQDPVAMVVTLICALTWLKVMEFLAEAKVVSSNTCRKCIHIGTGPMYATSSHCVFISLNCYQSYLLCWNVFSTGASARYWAAAVPGLITLKFAMVGLSLLKDEKTVKSMSRTGHPSELLRGPLLYGT